MIDDVTVNYLPSVCSQYGSYGSVLGIKPFYDMIECFIWFSGEITKQLLTRLSYRIYIFNGYLSHVANLKP